jgi:hypothetical protein
LAGWLKVTWLAGGEAGTAFLHLAKLATSDDRLENRASKLSRSRCTVIAKVLRGYYLAIAATQH